MERPVMNPMFLEGAPPPPRRKKGLIWRITKLLQFVVAVFMFDLFFWRKRSKLTVEDGSLLMRMMRGLAYRLVFLPVLLFFVFSCMVWLGTHPYRAPTTSDPLSQGTYFDPVSFNSRDGTRIEGWLVPVVTAKNVLEQKDKILNIKSPAVVLVPDHANSRTQMLPLVKPLHKAGYIVLVVELRGTNGATTGLTFGLNEADDIVAGVDMLRRRSDVDASRIAVLGIGTGANAAMLAGAHDGGIAAVILERPVKEVDEMIYEHLGPPQPWLRWARPVCKWIFEVAYRVDTDDLNTEDCQRALRGRPVLFLDTSGAGLAVFQKQGSQQMQEFLARYVAKKPVSGLAGVN